MKLRHPSKLGNRNKLSLILSLSMLLLVGCKDTPLDPDPEYPYYTISGRVFKGYGEVPLANSQIKLEYTDQGANFLEGIDAGVLGTTKTDADGYFTLDYQGFTGSPPDRELDGLYLYAASRLILEAFPWNEEVERDFAEIDHSQVYIEAINLPDSIDTFYIEVPFPIGSEFAFQLDYPGMVEGFTKPVLGIPVSNGTAIASVKCDVGSDWMNSGRTYFYAYGMTRGEIRRSSISGVVDSIPDDENVGTFSLRGFPLVDSLRLNFQ